MKMKNAEVDMIAGLPILCGPGFVRVGRRPSGYTQRWQVETVMSMIQRDLGEVLSGRCFHARNRQMRMLADVHNIMIVWLRGVLRQSRVVPF